MLQKRLQAILGEQKISLAQFAEMCDLPYETVRNVYYGRTVDPKISTVMKMAQALHLTVNCFMGQCSHSKEERALLQYYRSCGNHGKAVIETSAKYEAVAAREERETEPSLKHKIPCLLAEENIQEGFIYDSCQRVYLETTVEKAFLGVRMSTNDLAPRYCKGDIVLLTNRFPKHGEYAIFYKGAKAFFKQFVEENGLYRLKSIHNTREDVVLTRLDDLDYIGTCIDIIRA